MHFAEGEEKEEALAKKQSVKNAQTQHIDMCKKSGEALRIDAEGNAMTIYKRDDNF